MPRRKTQKYERKRERAAKGENSTCLFPPAVVDAALAAVADDTLAFTGVES